MEKERGISITTSVMQFPYNGCLVNLLDTPGHEDFSEDTYRVLTAVDCCLMVIDAAKGVEERTRKLMEVTRLRTTPILTFMNKLDRETRDPMELMDEVENELEILCAPSRASTISTATRPISTSAGRAPSSRRRGSSRASITRISTRPSAGIRPRSSGRRSRSCRASRSALIWSPSGRAR